MTRAWRAVAGLPLAFVACRAVLSIDDVHLRDDDAGVPDAEPPEADGARSSCRDGDATFCADFDTPMQKLEDGFVYALREPASSASTTTFLLDTTAYVSPPASFLVATPPIAAAGPAAQHALVWNRVVAAPTRIDVSFRVQPYAVDLDSAVTVFSLHFGNVNDETKRTHVDLGIRSGVFGLTQLTAIEDGGKRTQRTDVQHVVDVSGWHRFRIVVHTSDGDPVVDWYRDDVLVGTVPRLIDIPGPGLTLFVGISYAPPGLAAVRLGFDDVVLRVE